MMRTRVKWERNLLITAFCALAGGALALSMAPTRPLAERVVGAETVFVGTLTNKVVDGDWVQADLIVNEPLKNAAKGKRVAVTWRLIMVGGHFEAQPPEGDAPAGLLKRVGGKPLFDAPEGVKGVAILDDKFKGKRYWLRDDKFEDLAKLDEVKKLLKATGAGSDKGKE